METLAHDLRGVQYGIADPADMDEMGRLLGAVFSERDPPAVALGITAAEFENFVRLFCSKAAADRLTMIARSPDTGRMVGALLTEDSVSPMPEGIELISPKFDPILDLLGQLDSEYRKRKALAPNESLHLFLLGVDRSSTGRGIAQRLIAECLKNGRRLGYRLAVTEATNTTSQHVFRKLGFTERVQRSYEDHRHDGTAFFTSIAVQGGPILMDKSLEDVP